MADWLLKSEPDDYSFEDLKRDGKTLWEGVRNPAAMKHLAEMKKGDRLVVYHTGKERAAVGLAKVSAAGSPPEIAAGKVLKEPVTLDTIKGSALFSDSPLVRMGRLSVVPLTAAQYEFLSK